MPGWFGETGVVRLGSEIRRRTVEPWQHATFCLGFVLNVLFGGWAIWIEIVSIQMGLPKHDVESLQAALVTFYPAVAGVTFVQIILEQRNDSRLMLSSFLFLLIILGSGTFLTFYSVSSDLKRIVTLTALFIFTMWFWVIANCDATMFRDNLDSAVGGNPTATLRGDPGVREN